MTDIVERLHVKWESMGDMANAERDEAAHAIICLRNECAMEVAHIAELKEQVRSIALERDVARNKIARIMEGLEGCCMTCEPIGVRNQQMERDIATLKAERDEARRWFCQRSEWLDGGDGTQTASEYGWDCFKENSK